MILIDKVESWYYPLMFQDLNIGGGAINSVAALSVKQSRFPWFDVNRGSVRWWSGVMSRFGE